MLPTPPRSRFHPHPHRRPCPFLCSSSFASSHHSTSLKRDLVCNCAQSYSLPANSYFDLSITLNPSSARVSPSFSRRQRQRLNCLLKRLFNKTFKTLAALSIIFPNRALTPFALSPVPKIRFYPKIAPVSGNV
ncbi:hypothetical protein SERLA73DRAFT_180582 [Serpula lacrymans var. lacrymans S7.3]|uniref:Uncharacterized protein n=2 Tax=Serpula lacrymans var. lacrymans TaxID=341189 RepID=F8PVD6_SERL3|nr:uncharacterized protein SERLADRAFT_466248 [Serpula lacrymans var. lacrymans S7.9]EGO00146.1 hypothetical protein SERLA73DRAFT_180582 [Serpula lacrymans var. lacrymans S7.3]EGO25708.1 hypothetical protein SERLADRAFT_466248 [Serpula lacrymans var. lacrymans S7.9]